MFTAQDLKEIFINNNWDWDNYFKFTVSRHPIERLYSAYKYKMREPNTSRNRNESSSRLQEHRKQFRELNLTFDDAVLSNKFNLNSQINWILSEKQVSLLDDIIKLEKIAHELPRVWQQLGLPPEEIIAIPNLNRSSGEANWESMLSNEAIEKIKTQYAKDFEFLKY